MLSTHAAVKNFGVRGSGSFIYGVGGCPALCWGTVGAALTVIVTTVLLALPSTLNGLVLECEVFSSLFPRI